MVDVDWSGNEYTCGIDWADKVFDYRYRNSFDYLEFEQMKKLDEVIKAFEICIGPYCSNTEHDVCPYLGESDMGCMKEPEKDALYYLKEYQRYQHTPSRNGHMTLVDYFEESQKNEPLDWEQLKQMEGKPVWVEMEGYKPNWGIVMNQDERNGRLLLCGYDKVAIRIEINKEGEGNTWQAYRKERSA